MFQKDSFRAAFLASGASNNSANTYASFLNRIDFAIGGLDEAVARDGSEAVMAWAGTTDKEPFETYRSHSRSVLRRYLEFRLGADEPSEFIEQEDLSSPAFDIDANFKIEKEMQAQVRTQISSIEAGLKVDDGGQETVVATGKIDIVARDAVGRLVAIELKAGKCPAGAIEQVLGYAHSLSGERGEPVRAMLIAGSFVDRQRAASKRAIDLQLITYAYNLSFSSDD